MKSISIILKYLIIVIVILSCSNNSVQEKLKKFQGRYLFLEYYFKNQAEGNDYTVNARGNKTYWIIKSDSILEEYSLRKNNEIVYYYDFVDKIEYLEKNQFKLYDTLVSTIKLVKDTLIIENDYYRYKLLKNNN